VAFERLEIFFSSYGGGFSYAYSFDSVSGNIYLEYDIEMEAKYTYCYTLVEDELSGVWLLETIDQVRTAVGISPAGSMVRVVGDDKESAIEAMIEWIIKRPKEHEEAKVDVVELEEKLRLVIKKFKD
jgi:hypothetical protein